MHEGKEALKSALKYLVMKNRLRKIGLHRPLGSSSLLPCYLSQTHHIIPFRNSLSSVFKVAWVFCCCCCFHCSHWKAIAEHRYFVVWKLASNFHPKFIHDQFILICSSASVVF